MIVARIGRILVTPSRRAEVLHRLQTVAAQTFRCEPALIQEQTTARDVPRWDSLRHLVFIGNVEQAFGCRLDLATVMQLDDIGALVDEIVKITAT